MGKEIIEKFLEEFDKHSRNNRTYGRLAFHVLIGQALKHIEVHCGGYYFDIRTHLMLLMPSGTGKSRGYPILNTIMQRLQMHVTQVTEITDAALLGTIEENPDWHHVTNPEVERWQSVPGLLQETDVFFMDESEILFNPKKTHIQSTLTYFQQAFNPIGSPNNLIIKKLAHGSAITVAPTCSGIFLSYTPKDVIDYIMTKGFFQRVILFPKKVSEEDRIKNQEEEINLLGTETANESNISDVVKFIKELQVKYAKTRSFGFSKDAKTVFKNQQKKFWLYTKTSTTRIKEIMGSFISRYVPMSYLLAVHHAIIHGRQLVEPADAKYSTELMLKTFQHLLSWLEDEPILGEEKDEKRHTVVVQSIYAKMKPDNMGYVLKSNLVKTLKKSWQVSLPTVNARLKIFESKIKTTETWKNGKKIWKIVEK